MNKQGVNSMILKTKLIASGAVALATTIGVLTTSFHSNKLSSSIKKNQEVTQKAIETMQQANSVIIQLDDKVNQDNQKIVEQNAEIKALKKQTNYPNMSEDMKKDVLDTMLSSWGYNDYEINIFNKAFGTIEDFHHGHWFNKLATTNHK